ncbi:MAG: putative two-component membrane permease complex subunit SMU_747c [Verrucomicrobiae bacterium]|nr:putative two-component membrane permease complex subunit SMU_747c [Verrucomicrobiae bacterium]
MSRAFDLAGTYLGALWSLLADLWLYFLIGFLIAGAIAEFVPTKTLLRHFGRNSAATYLRAMLAGMLASLCSCGAIPIAATLRARGVSRAAALTFMLAAPWAGFMQLLVFYRFLGFGGTAVVFVGALMIAFLTGTVLGWLEDRGWLNEAADSARVSNGPVTAGCEGGSCDCDASVAPSFARRLLRAGTEAWEAFLALWKYLAFGLLLAGTLKAFVPVEWVGRFLGPQATFNPVLTAVPLAAAVELCSEGFSIFAGQLHQMGATLAVVFVVVLVGVTTDFTELSVIWGKFGKRSAAAHLLTATTLTLVFGLIIQQVFR